MKTKILSISVFILLILSLSSSKGQIGTRFPSEKKTVKDPVTGALLAFLTSSPAGFKNLSDSSPVDFRWTMGDFSLRQGSRGSHGC